MSTEEIKEMTEFVSKAKHRITSLENKNAELQRQQRRYFSLAGNLTELVNCVLSHRLVNGMPLYTDTQSMIEHYVRQGILQDWKMHPNILDRMPFTYANDLTPLNKREVIA